MTALVLIVPLALAILVAPRAANAQQPIKVFRIGVLYTGSASPSCSPSAEAFQQRLHDLGYVEGQNIMVDTAMRRGSSSGCLIWRLSWCASRWTSS